MSDARLVTIREALAEIPAPPWHWVGDTYSGPILCTQHGGWRTVMAFRRLGMRGAQPVFPVANETDSGRVNTILVDARELMVARALYDLKTFRGIDNPVARWIEHSAEYVAELLAEIERLNQELADVRPARAEVSTL